MATIALRRLVASIESGVSVVSDSSLTDATNYVLKTSAVSRGIFDVAERKPVTDPTEAARLACAVAAGNLIVSRMNTTELVGACGFVEKSACDTYLPDRLWQVTLRSELCCPKFVYWWTATEQYRAQVKSVCAGTSQSMQNISQEQFLGFSLPLHPVTVQQRIADYLDAKTTAIDALIAKKELLIEELRKYQEAVITEALSHKSGWVAIPLKRVAYFNPTPPQSLSDSAVVSFLPMAAFSEFGALDLTQEKTVKDIRAGYTYFRDGDVAYAKVTPCFENGKGAILRDLVGGCGFGTTELTVLRPKEQFDSRFLAYALRTKKFQQYGLAHMEGTGGLKRVPDRTAANFIQSFPGKAEQELIADALDETMAKIARLTAKTIAQVSDLVSYRSALISETVSGKGAIK